MTPLNASNRLDRFEMPPARGRIVSTHLEPRLDEPQTRDDFVAGPLPPISAAQTCLAEPAPLKSDAGLASTNAPAPSTLGPDAFATAPQLTGSTPFATNTDGKYQPITFDLSQPSDPSAEGELDPLLGSLAQLSKTNAAPDTKLEPVAYGLGNFPHLALDKQKAISEMMKAQYATFPPNTYHGLNSFVRRVLDRQKAVEEMMKIQQGMSAAPEATRQVTCAGLSQAQVITGVFKNLKALGLDQAHFCVDQQIFSKLDKLKLDPVEFFTARACWQGGSSKRRAILEGVLDQFPALPKDRKNWQSAVVAAQAKGVEVTETDKLFIKYFMENRKAMKTLFRATLPSGFEGKTVTCFRGQLAAENNTTKSLGCYSVDPSAANIWGSREGSNVKRFRVHVNDIWSTYTATQNSRRCERELTVYSRNGVRAGKQVTDQAAAGKQFWARYEKDLAAQETERMAWGWSVGAALDS